MMTQGDRIKHLRKELKLSQEAFGNRIGVVKSSISELEKNKRPASNQVTKAICREFNVNYAWLIDGVGEMYIDVNDMVLKQLKQKYNLDETDSHIIELYLKVPKEKKQFVRSYIDFLVEEELKNQQKKDKD